MNIEAFVKTLGAEFYTGVPDSLLKSLCNYFLHTYPHDASHHVIAANEGNAVAIAAGYHLATGKVPVVYMQNSGEGNIVNPVASLLHQDVYGIPMIFVVGWRGEPGVHDEPQHAYQGQITRTLLDLLEIPSVVVGKGMTVEVLQAAREKFEPILQAGHQVAFVIEKGALSSDLAIDYRNSYSLTREDALAVILDHIGDIPVVSTTGKASREIFELREKRGERHGQDFLTVGSMGHASSIALGIALQKPQQHVCCIDGDGAVLMHMGSMAIIGQTQPKNLLHIIIDNEAHESVGGFPTAARNVDFVSLAKACGYVAALEASSADELAACIHQVGNMKGPVMLLVRCAVGARANLGRPTTTPQANKLAFMKHIMAP